jgi:uncharacterized protein (TIGR03435 family)
MQIVQRSNVMLVAAAVGSGLCAATLVAQAAQSAGDADAVRFEVASIKRNVGGNVATSPPVLPNGEIRLVNMPARNVVLMAYPLEMLPSEIIGSPSWLDSERYDVIAKGKAAATADERREMWRALLADRMKLAAHYETREKPTYDLVIARSDRRLGAGLKSSTLDCTQSTTSAPPAPGASMRELGLARCRSFGIDRDGTMYSGGVEMAALARMISPTAGRPVIDRTGLEGFFSVAFRYQRLPQRADAAPSPDDPPALFTALQEQLGLKLEPAKAQLPVLVIDRIERPDPD